MTEDQDKQTIITENHELPQPVRDQLAVLQHQINNPLAVVLGNVQFLLLKKDGLEEKVVARLEKIEKAALKICSLNEQLTPLIRSGKEEAEKTKNSSSQVEANH